MEIGESGEVLAWVAAPLVLVLERSLVVEDMRSAISRKRERASGPPDLPVPDVSTETGVKM